MTSKQIQARLDELRLPHQTVILHTDVGVFNHDWQKEPTFSFEVRLAILPYGGEACQHFKYASVREALDGLAEINGKVSKQQEQEVPCA